MRIIRLTALAVACLLASCDRAPRTAGPAAPERWYLFSLQSTAGLKENAPITFLGVKVGHIANIRLSPDGGSVVATGAITNPEMRLREGDTARLATVALLADPEIQIVRPSPAAPAPPELEAGSQLAVSSPPEISLSPENKKQLEEIIGRLLDPVKPSFPESPTFPLK